MAAVDLDVVRATDWTETEVVDFTADLNGAPERLQEVLGAKSSTPQFSLRAVTFGQGDFKDFGESRLIKGGFCVDGEFGFLIQALDTIYGPVNIGIVSFNLNQRLYDGVVDRPGRFPRIVQLQGCTSPDDPIDRRKRVWRGLNAFRLEAGEVNLTEHFARAVGYGMVGIVPVEANPSRNHIGFDEKRGRLRYDGTAQNLSFDQEDQSIYLKVFG